jgi:hypothetical protein
VTVSAPVLHQSIDSSIIFPRQLSRRVLVFERSPDHQYPALPSDDSWDHLRSGFLSPSSDLEHDEPPPPDEPPARPGGDSSAHESHDEARNVSSATPSLPDRGGHTQIQHISGRDKLVKFPMRDKEEEPTRS